MTYPPPPAPEAPAPRRVLVWAVVIVAALLAVVFGLQAAGDETGDVAESDASTELAEASEACGAGVVSDEGHTLFLNMKGEDEAVQTWEAEARLLSIEDILCVLIALDMPDSKLYLMSETRALDGRQATTWGDFEASWSYHPDSGLDILLTEA